MTADELLKALAELIEAAQELKQMPSNESLKGYIADGLQHTLGALGVNPCEAPSITEDEAVTLAIGVGGALFSGNAGNERTYIMSRSDIGRFARAVQKGSTAGVDLPDGAKHG